MAYLHRIVNEFENVKQRYMEIAKEYTLSLEVYSLFFYQAYVIVAKYL